MALLAEIAQLQTVLLQLYEQLAVLQSRQTESASTRAIVSRPVVAEGGILSESGARVVEAYDTTGPTVFIADLDHRAYYRQLLHVLPDQYDSSITQFIVFDLDDVAFDAYVETIVPYTGEWQYGINLDGLLAPRSDSSIELMIHEFAHMWSLDQAYRDRNRNDQCHQYFNTICAPIDSVYGQFVEQFWNDARLDWAERIKRDSTDRTLDRFYDRYSDEFVTNYAAINPQEDLAESFVAYVLGDSAAGVAAEKIDFFNNFLLARGLAAQLRANIGAE
jgi:hypothetical protein